MGGENGLCYAEEAVDRMAEGVDRAGSTKCALKGGKDGFGGALGYL